MQVRTPETPKKVVNPTDNNAEITFINSLETGHFSEDSLSWLAKLPTTTYIFKFPSNHHRIVLPCHPFVERFGKQKNYRTKLHDIFESLPASIHHVTLDSMMLLNGKRDGLVYSFDIRRALEAMHGNEHITSLSLKDNRLLTLREYRKLKTYAPNDSFSMIMRGISPSVTLLDLSGNDPFSDFVSSKMMREKIAKINQLHISIKRKDSKIQELISFCRDEITYEYQKKLSQIPGQIQHLDLSSNYLNKFGEDDLLKILWGLTEKKNLKTLNLSDNGLDTLSADCISHIQHMLPQVAINFSKKHFHADSQVESSESESYLPSPLRSLSLFSSTSKSANDASLSEALSESGKHVITQTLPQH